MPDFNDRIDNFCIGDDLDVRRKVKAIPEGQTVTQAWLTIKNKISETDEEAVIQKIITAVAEPGVGEIEDAGAGGTTAILRFELTREDTLLLSPDRAYHHDVQIKTSADKISTPFKGMVIPKAQVTISE